MSVQCIQLSHRRCKSHRGLYGLWLTLAVAHMGCSKRHQYQECEGAMSLYTNL